MNWKRNGYGKPEMIEKSWRFCQLNFIFRKFSKLLELLQPQIWSSKSKSQINRQSLFVFPAKNPRFWRAYKIFRYHPRSKHLIVKRIKLKIWTQNFCFLFFKTIAEALIQSLSHTVCLILCDSYLYKIALWRQGIDFRILRKSKWLDS